MNEDPKNTNPPDQKRNPIASVVVALVGVACGAYLINPTAGFIELIPDNLPFVGNLDEAGAAAILISCFAYFGLDIGALFGRGKKDETKEAKGEVIDS
ncbi:MAG: DUF1232 domain-containing protein [Verrucomicrobiales bacterium]|nr:DUF1232 domain-containing protein [Verrucomicrobiales bacterium]